ncbi:response regulator [Desulfosporosinus sp. OT]|uniref:response regulator n=1 Tax=Desulfosporosinus sp. OT TaxID=913865 RepID=UPI0002239DBE|nr:response regulator [Desulfosporosinus sp. OT]EGW35915.1 response regulator [Desulfosporosinus sp. OT]
MYRLLIADDEQLERQALQFIIQTNFPEIEVVGDTGDGASAVRIALSEKPDIVLMDIRMPGMDGLEAAKSILDGLPNTSVLMLTAMDDFSSAKQALTIGAVAYLLKPVRTNELVRTLRTITDKINELKLKQEEEALLRENIEKAKPFIQMSFVHDLVSGNISDLKQFTEQSRFLGMPVDPGVALVVDIDNFKQLTSSNSELEKQMLKQRVYQLICNVVGENGIVTPFSSDNLIILLGFKEVVEQDLIKAVVWNIATNIRDCILQNMNVSITVGIGRYYVNPLDMQKSYREAINAQRQRFYLGDSQIIHVEDVPHLSTGPFNYPFHDERTVLDKVRCGDRNQAKLALKELLEAIFASKASIETVKACVLELLIVLSRAAVEGGANLDQLTLLNFNSINVLIGCCNKEQVEKWMLESLDCVMDNMLENRSSVNIRVINKACEYIAENCHKNISLEEVAQTVHLSRFYFSRLFKQEKGCNFVDYISNVRIDRAKLLLKNTDYNGVRIAAEVGYQDASYFSRVFRQATDMTPNQYRNKARQKED